MTVVTFFPVLFQLHRLQEAIVASLPLSSCQKLTLLGEAGSLEENLGQPMKSDPQNRQSA